ncbi:SMI1/KNR4 family protein [Streptomyces sp. NPDC007095]|jgi:cell wall assembly regulator SMI1|uniref:SMI1/KNR4 family protein n=1 Tax=Streptomyces sp. NPDC007095 TaxID=3154482 RepID=UPI0033C0796A
MEDVSQAWTAINDWLARFAPASAEAQHPPADPEAIAAAERELGFKFPADGVQSLLIHDGQPRYCTDFPDYPLLSVEGIVDVRQRMMTVVGDDLGGGDSDDCWWHEGWLPVSELDGDLYIVDLRSGPAYGRLGWFPRDDEVDFDQRAPTFAAHLTQIATALTTGGAVDGEVPYITEHGAVYWDYPGQETTDEGERLFRAPTG